MRNGLLSALGAWRARRSADDPAAPVGMEGILTGYYEYRGGRVSGWVEDRRGPPRGPIVIRAVRRGQTLLAGEVEKLRSEKRFNFSMNVQGICSAADLFKDEVRIVARNLLGDSGTLLIEGANALELIRDVAGVPATTILDLSFARNGNARPYLASGWSESEEMFTWTVGHDSFLTINNPAQPGMYVLRISASALLHKALLTSQLLQIFVQNEYVSQFVMQRFHTEFMECKVPGELLLSAPSISIRFHHPDAIPAHDINGNNDPRLLGIRFIRLSLARLHAPNQDGHT